MELNLLEDLAPAERDAFLAKCVRRRYARRQALFHLGDASDGMYVVTKGRVVVRISTPAGEEATLTVVGPRKPGRSAIAADRRRPAVGHHGGGRAGGDAVPLRAGVPRDLRDERNFDQVMITLLASRVIRLTGQLVEALYVPATTRVLRRVAEAAAMYGDGTIPLTQEELATMAGSTRHTADRVLRAAEDANVLELRRGSIRVLDLEKLRYMAESPPTV